jgi:hypothetical protein
MVKAQKPKTKARAKPKPRFTDKAESERFIETARKLGVEEASDAFERAVRKLASFLKSEQK